MYFDYCKVNTYAEFQSKLITIYLLKWCIYQYLRICKQNNERLGD